MLPWTEQQKILILEKHLKNVESLSLLIQIIMVTDQDIIFQVCVVP